MQPTLWAYRMYVLSLIVLTYICPRILHIQDTNTQYITEQAKYDFWTFMSVLGGAFGLWTGLSVLALVQFVEVGKLVDTSRPRSLFSSDDGRFMAETVNKHGQQLSCRVCKKMNNQQNK